MIAFLETAALGVYLYSHIKSLDSKEFTKNINPYTLFVFLNELFWNKTQTITL